MRKTATPSPFGLALRASGLTQVAFARRSAVSGATVCRWVDGGRRPSKAAFALLALLGAPQIEAEHTAWMARQKRGPAGELTLTFALPANLTVDQARDQCIRALAQIAEGTTT